MASPAPAGIQAISRADVHRITSGQVVLDIQSAVKELVENALDAGARAIEVRFKEHGSESIEVIDNGSGIQSQDYDGLGRKHHTSKLSSFHDLTSVQTFGFRGEALSSLCELGHVQITTATKEEEPVGTVLDLHRDGTIQSCEKRVARQRGTTVTVNELFATLPVRRRELLKNVKREFAKAQTMLQAYVIVSRGVRWVVTNSVKGRKTNIMTITGASSPDSLQSNMAAVFGSKACTSLLPLALHIPIGEGEVQVQGLISRPTHGSGRSASDRTFLYLNGRPWDSSRIVRALNEVYKSFNGAQFPVVVANFLIQGDKYDVNVSPDKRTLFLHDEGDMIEGLKTALEELFKPLQSTFTVNGANLTAAKVAALQSRLAFQPAEHGRRDGGEGRGGRQGREASPTVLSSDDDEDRRSPVKRRKFGWEERNDRESVLSSEMEALDEDTPVLDSTNASSLGSTAARPTRTTGVMKRNSSPTISFQFPSQGRKASQSTIEVKLSRSEYVRPRQSAQLQPFVATPSYTDSEDEERRRKEVEDDALEYREDQEGDDQQEGSEGLQDGVSDEHSETEGQQDETRDESSTGSIDGEGDRETNLSRLDEEGASDDDAASEPLPAWVHEATREDGGVALSLSMADLQQRLSRRAEMLDPGIPVEQVGSELFEQAGVEEKDSSAVEEALSRSIVKTDFERMTVIGQFNLGFILVRRRMGTEDDVFIVDQHAADEKFNFEALQQTTRLKSQRLLRPRLLQLPSSVEFVAAQHLDTLAAHGFDVKVDEEAVPGSRVQLLALPISKNTTFGVADLEELLHRLHEVAPGSRRAQAIRCSKWNDMLASRACRKSVMIGRALTTRQMNVILHHMGQIDQPWNCPHGRPTMRHLHQLHTYPQQAQGAIDWLSLL